MTFTFTQPANPDCYIKHITDGTNIYNSLVIEITLTKDLTLTAVCECKHDVSVTVCPTGGMITPGT